jgi:cell division protein FtsI/penicillin-binding protein 2
MRITIKQARLSYIAIALLTAVITSAIWGLAIDDQKSAYQKEIASRYSDFLEFQQPVKQNIITDRQTDSVATINNAEFATAVSLDLHTCTPGAAKVRYINGTIHFAFSGVKRVETSLTSNDCIFYMGKEQSGQPWNQALNVKCEWIISSIFKYRYSDNILLPVDGNGVQFGDFLNNCQDLQTGHRPAQL